MVVAQVASDEQEDSRKARSRDARDLVKAWRTPQVRAMGDLSCSRFVKFSLPKFWKYVPQDPRTFLGTRVHVVLPKGIHIEGEQGGIQQGVQQLRSYKDVVPPPPCEYDSMFLKLLQWSRPRVPRQDLTTRTRRTRLEVLRRLQHVAMGNYVVFRDLRFTTLTTLRRQGWDDADSYGIVLGITQCSEDHVLHAHLCTLIPPGYHYFCSGIFAMNTRSGTFACFARSGTWKIFKDVCRTFNPTIDAMYDHIDDVSCFISQKVIRHTLGARTHTSDVMRVLGSSKLGSSKLGSSGH